MKDFNQQEFNLLRKISKKPESSQRELASKMDVSLGKLNYLLNELKLKGLIKIKNFKRHPNKTGYLYLLTPRGIAEKTKITLNFMKRKLQEYDELKKEVENINKKQKRIK
ncbi:MAG: MarR family EPS-associated transcriptional regulator [Candidatus Pelagibacter sp.]|nr:MarR family EPS-associated transcriptional regulator [Candidatus Pelagibacter sp.]|tara:strand:+ start:13342 stop:13671 length:330 start_codon:yes stop_codon:yes gene_type:complete